MIERLDARKDDLGGLVPNCSWWGRSPASATRRLSPGWAVALFVAFAVCIPSVAAVGCVAGCGGTAAMVPASPTGGPRTPFPAATTSMSEGRSGLRIVSVVPPPYAMGPWTGADVIVAYLPIGAPVVPSRCWLTVDGRRQGARISWATLSPAQPILIFSWSAPYPPGNYRFRVTVVARGGKRAVAEWTYVYR